MRVLLLVLTLLVAGCTTPAATEDPVTPLGEDDPLSDPTGEPTPPPSRPTPEPTPPPSRPTPETPPAEPPAPEPPALQPWTLAGEARLGWAAAVGAGGAAAAQGTQDADRCADASFLVPAGATRLHVKLAGEPVDPNGPGAGTYRITLVAPDATAVAMQPATKDVPEAEGATNEHVAEPPAVGEWKLHAEPIGPAVQQVWTLTIELAGESVEMPAALVVMAACSGS